jgi:hypothetical protein
MSDGEIPIVVTKDEVVRSATFTAMRNELA